MNMEIENKASQFDFLEFESFLQCDFSTGKIFDLENKKEKNQSI
jgi:hypothetical protein